MGQYVACRAGVFLGGVRLFVIGRHFESTQPVEDWDESYSPPLTECIFLDSPQASVIQKFGFINGVDNLNWPPYRDSKS